jgi:hypothetical protein
MSKRENMDAVAAVFETEPRASASGLSTDNPTPND